MIIQIVKFETTLSEAELWEIAEERINKFRALPGLIQKYYTKLEQPNRYSGIYVWDSRESLEAFRASELAASIPTAYKVTATPTVETFESVFQLRE